MLHYIKVKAKKDKREIETLLERTGLLYDDKLYQTCHLFEYEGQVYIIHFKEYFSLFSYINDGRIEDYKIRMEEIDELRRNSIILYLYDNEYIGINKSIKNYLMSKSDIYDYTVLGEREAVDFKLIKKVDF